MLLLRPDDDAMSESHSSSGSGLDSLLLSFVTAAIVASGLWSASDVAGLVPSLILVGWCIVLLRIRATCEATLAEPLPRLGLPRGRELATGIVLVAPALLALSLSWNSEFPFSGDHNVHLRHLYVALDLWARLWIPAFLSVLLILPWSRRFVPPWTAVIVLGTWLSLGVWFDPEARFATRYPGTLHFLAVPLAAATTFLHAGSAFDALRLSNALAIPAWLFVLRPWILRRWPDLRIVPFAVFLLFQKDVVYFMTSAYLEPWTLVLFALAVELVVAGRPDDGWKAVLLAFAAALFKEYTILLAPGIAGAAYLRSANRQTRLRVLLSTTTGMVLFAFYYTARLRAEVFGASGFDPNGVRPARFVQYAERASQQFGIALPLVVLLLVLLVWRSRGPEWRTYAPLACALLVHNIYFFGETLTSGWLANPRFQLPALAFLSAPLFRLPRALATRNRVLAIAGAMAALQIAAAIPYIDALRRHELSLNFFEHIQAPIYLPFRQLVNEAETRGWTRDVKQLRILSNLHGVKTGYLPVSLPLAYPDIAERYKIDVRPLDASMIDRCSCQSSGEGVVGLYVYFRSGALPDAPREAIERSARECHRRIVSTCTASFALRYDDQLVASFGTLLPPANAHR